MQPYLRIKTLSNLYANPRSAFAESLIFHPSGLWATWQSMVHRARINILASLWGRRSRQAGGGGGAGGVESAHPSHHRVLRLGAGRREGGQRRQKAAVNVPGVGALLLAGQALLGLGLGRWGGARKIVPDMTWVMIKHLLSTNFQSILFLFYGENNNNNHLWLSEGISVSQSYTYIPHLDPPSCELKMPSSNEARSVGKSPGEGLRELKGRPPKWLISFDQLELEVRTIWEETKKY